MIKKNDACLVDRALAAAVIRIRTRVAARSWLTADTQQYKKKPHKKISLKIPGMSYLVYVKKVWSGQTEVSVTDILSQTIILAYM